MTLEPPTTPLPPEPRRKTRRRSPLRVLGVIAVSVVIVIIAIVVAVIVFRVAAAVISETALLFTLAAVAGVLVAYGLSLLVLMRTARRRNGEAAYASRTRTSTITGAVTAVVLVAVSVVLNLPVADGPVRPEAPAETQYAELSTGSRVAWWKVEAEEKSDKPPVIFLHGGPGAFVNGPEALFARLTEEGRDVYFYDQVGAGNSELLPGDEYSIERLVDDLAAFQESVVRSDTVSVIGHSFGGFLAEAYATGNPEKIEKVVLINPLNYALPEGMTEDEANAIERPPIPEESVPQQQPIPPLSAAKFLIASELETINPRASENYMSQEEQLSFMAGALGSPGGLSTLANVAVTESASAIADEVMSQVEKTALPTLVLRAEFDYILWPSLKMYRDLNENAEMVYLPGLAHTDIEEDDTAVFDPIRAFLDDEPLPETYDGEEDPHFFFADRK